ncbi:hypothetical protein [Lysinibacillus sp. fls2-241-R2A-57]|uniref:hypothetical protein n=1 Tax=Lysinibacillus sp. fls2-241-R2A-57 TaxID=3040292 RepID=UPI002556BFFC|nr:hypothetical protein [Lysinibacillus sp. fls2-241-R2A-57]
MYKTNILLKKIAETIPSSNILSNFNEISTGYKYDALMIEYWGNTHEDEEKLKQLGNVLSPEGMAFVLVPATVLFSMKHKSNREYILNNFHIKGVITLKNTVFD